MARRKLVVVFALLALFSLTGTDCLFYARSGGSASLDDDETTGGLLVVIRDGRFVDAPVEGLGYRSGQVAGVTGTNGEFRYQQGEPVTFFIGAIVLGAPVAGKALLTPLDLVPQGTLASPAVINIARLLQSLDAVPGDGRISIPPRVSAAATAATSGVAEVLPFLDFGDDTHFVNAAAQLVAMLTADYPFTAVLVDAASARGHLRRSMAAAQAPGADPVASP